MKAIETASKKIILLIFLLVIFATSFTLVFAQDTENNDGQQKSLIKIFPAQVELKEKGKYNLTIQNSTEQDLEFNLQPAAFQIDAQNNKITPINNDFLQSLGINIDEYIKIEQKNINVNSKEDKKITINYLKKLDGYLVGVYASSSTSNNSNVAINSNLASVILDLSISKEELAKIKNNIKVKSTLNLSAISFTNNYTIESQVINESNTLIKPTGEVQITSGNKRINSLALSPRLNKVLYPNSNVTLNSDFLDSRPLHKRIGKLTFTQIVKIGDEYVTVKRDVLLIPWETIFIVASAIVAVLIVRKILKKLKNNKNYEAKS